MSVTPSASSQPNSDDKPWSGFEFELHYGLSAGNVRDILSEILTDTATYTQIHDWDKKFTISAFQKLARLVRSFLQSNLLGLNTLLGQASVEEVFTIEGTNYSRPAIQQAADIDNYLFFSRVSYCLLISTLTKRLTTREETVRREKRVNNFYQ
jgi:hypothetical protein